MYFSNTRVIRHLTIFTSRSRYIEKLNKIDKMGDASAFPKNLCTFCKITNCSWNPVGLVQKKQVGVPINGLGNTGVEIPKLFSPLKIRGVTFPNRIVVSPMCMYSCEDQDGVFTDFHLVHLGSLALRGPSVVFIEATAISPEGRLSPLDTGIWNDKQAESLSRITRFTKASGSLIAIQLAHGGRKSSTYPPFHNYEESEGRLGRGIVPDDEGGFGADIVAPSPIPWKSPDYPTPNELTTQDVKNMVQKFSDAAKRAVQAGVDIIEIHAAHGYLIHEFLSGNTNKRSDIYGGNFENRIRFLLEIITDIRAVIPADMPLFCRVSGTDYTGEEGDILGIDPDGWDIAQVTELCKRAVPLGLDVIDISSGGNQSMVIKGLMQNDFGFQAPLAEYVKKANIPGLYVAAVGSLQDAKKAEDLLQNNKTDFIAIARHFISDPCWVYTAAEQFNLKVRRASQYSWFYSLK